MSLKQWLALLCFYTTYLFLGASIFYHIESRLELERRHQDKLDRMDIQELFQKYDFPSDRAGNKIIMDKLTVFCQRSVYNYTEQDEDAPMVWDFYHSFFFSFTVSSTVGYGNLAPHSTLGRMVMIVFAIFGIPLHGILLTQLANYFGHTFEKLYDRYKSHKMKTSGNLPYDFGRMGLVGQVVLYLVPGFLFFIFLPSGLFVLFEDWPYDVAVYYAFVTLTTIGFGDYVAGMQDKGYGAYFVMYKIFLIFWMTFGLGYILMCMGFILKAMQSKRIARLEHKLALNWKATQSRIWNGVTKDVGYLRRILNELYLYKIKPVYIEAGSAYPSLRTRSASCPDLTLYSEPCEVRRRRANSENLHMTQPALVRVQSDSDISRIDKARTFESVAMVQPSELLAQVVSALGDFASTEEEDDEYTEGGVHGFSDRDILASERAGSIWSMGSERMYAEAPRKPRGRAASEVRIRDPEKEFIDNNPEWTWSGPSANKRIKELMRQRRNKGKPYKDSFVLGAAKSQSLTPDSVPTTPSNRSIMGRFNPFRRRESAMPDVESYRAELPPARYVENTRQGRASLQRQYLADTIQGRNSAFSLPPDTGERSTVLEETSIADLLRALNALHASHGVDEGFAPRRKMGLASLTPPKLPPMFSTFPPTVESAQVPLGPARLRRMSLRPVGFITNPAAGSRRQSIATTPTFNPARRQSLHPPPYTPGGDTSSTTSASPRARSPHSVAYSLFSVRPTVWPNSNAAQPPGARRMSLRPLNNNTPTLAMAARRFRLGQPPRGPLILPRRSRHESIASLTDIDKMS